MLQFSKDGAEYSEVRTDNMVQHTVCKANVQVHYTLWNLFSLQKLLMHFPMHKHYTYALHMAVIDGCLLQAVDGAEYSQLNTNPVSVTTTIHPH